jgi:hypothetical protein
MSPPAGTGPASKSPPRGRHRSAMPDDVGERVLENAVRCAADCARHWSVADLELDGQIQPGFAGGAEELVELREPVLRHPVIVLVTKHAQDAAHLLQRVGARVSSALELAWAITSRVSRARSGRLSSTCAVTPAWTLMIAIACATVS